MYVIATLATFVFIPLITGLILDSGNGDLKDVLTTETLVKRQGFPFENHTVTTEDGYILELHRIPYSPGSQTNSNTTRPVAFLFHCLLCSSSDWVILDRNNSLAFILSDAGYDVWMGNARGTTYSRKNLKYSPVGPDSKKFWDFSWHEMGVIDLPTMFDYVLKTTGVEQLRFFAHSQGTATFFVLTSMKPKYNKIFKSAHLLSPIAYLSNSFNKYLLLGGPIVGNSRIIQNTIASTEIRPSSLVITIVGNALCTDFFDLRLRVLCKNTLFLVAGFTPETVNKTIIPDLMASNPGGASTTQIVHFVQEYVSGYFRQFDHGVSENLRIYGSSSPPEYPLEKINVPIYLYSSEDDNFADPKDVERLVKRLKTLAGHHFTKIKDFDHMAHMYSDNLYEKLLQYVMKDVNSS